MRFKLLDRITALEAGESITAVKKLSGSEDYLKDHFPLFPVMPGVLMVESMFQASMWLVRATEEFKHSTVVMREAKSMKFQGFMQPGDELEVVAEVKGREDSLTKLRVRGFIAGNVAVSGRMVVDSYNLFDREGVDIAFDNYMRLQFCKKFRLLCELEELKNFAVGV